MGRRIFLLFVVVLTAAAQGPRLERIVVEFPYPVIVNGSTLPAGRYSLTEPRKGAIRISGDNGTNLELTPATVPSLNNTVSPETDLVLRQIGGDYYLNKIWIQGKDYGYDFPLSKALEKKEKKLGPPAMVHIPGMWARSGGTRMRLSGHGEHAKPAPEELTPEERLNRRVRDVLLALPGYGVFDQISYALSGHTVTLLGQVANPALKTAAGQQAGSVEGVSQVNNEIAVLPASPDDDRIRQAEYKAIYEHPALAKYATSAVAPIHIIVNQKHVILTGTVADEADKSVAGEQARTVPGVLSVTNDLRVGQPGA